MIFQNAWAWTGLILLVMPLVIHLLGRRSARVQSFPTLRFLEPSRVLPVRWTRLTDLPLLAVRLAILALAAAALAQPLLLTAARRDSGIRALARAIIVDTSASMMRRLAAGMPAVDSARAHARRAGEEASTQVIIESAIPAASLAGAAGWLETQPGSREIIVVSDFQRGTIDSTDLAVVAAGIGVRFIRLGVPATAVIESVTRTADTETVARVDVADSLAAIAWMVRPAPDSVDDAWVLLTGESERARADAARLAAFEIGAPRAAPGRAVVIVYPEFAGRDSLLRSARHIDVPWMGDAVVRMHADPLLNAAAAGADPVDTALERTGNAAAVVEDSLFVAVARTEHGEPLALAARDAGDGRDRLLLFAQIDAGSLASAALLAAAARALAPAVPASEMDPLSLDDDALTRWTREPSQVVRLAQADASDGRWVWILVLLLLGFESWLRRERRVRENEPAHSAVAP